MTNAEPDAKTGNDRCWGAILRGDTEGKHCAPDFQMGKHHFKTKFCRTCSEEGILVTADRCRIVQTSAPAENGTTLGFWKIAPNHRGARYRLINQTAKCTKPPYLVLENASSAIASAAFLRPMPASFIDTQGCVLLHVLNGTLVPFAASDRLFISRPGRSRKRAAEEAAPPAVPGLDLQQHSMLQLYHQQHQQEGQMARAMLLTLQASTAASQPPHRCLTAKAPHLPHLTPVLVGSRRARLWAAAAAAARAGADRGDADRRRDARRAARRHRRADGLGR